MAGSFSTSSGIPLHHALGYEERSGEYTRRKDTTDTCILEQEILAQGIHFGSMHTSRNFIEGIASISREDGEKPDENSLGRECYSFSERENAAFSYTKSFVEAIVGEINALSNKNKASCKIETDAIGNMYITVTGNSSEMHMVGSHLDSVRNGGKYDGVAGIAAGIETLRQVLYFQSKGKLQNSFCLAVFRSEESGPYNGVACLGSSVATGTISPEKLENIVYTSKNGEPVTLRQHLTSSLMAYFQSHANKDWGKRNWPDKEEGEVYIDHPWWYDFCKEHDLLPKDASEWDEKIELFWQKIIENLSKPRISRQKVATYSELHIEQGTLIEQQGVDLGIVSGGIGGAQRYKTISPIGVEEVELNAGEYELYSFDVFGFSDHTGSTPNNPDLENSDFRRDAQIATNLFLRVFLESDFGELISSQALNDEGYTKIPFAQAVKFAIKKERKKEFTQFIRNQRALLRNQNGVEFSESEYSDINSSTLCCISRTSAINAIGVLLSISDTASQEFRRQREDKDKTFGTTRATLTNVSLSLQGLRFCLDIREVDTKDVEELIEGISQSLKSIIPEGIQGLHQVSCKVHQEIDGELRDTIVEISKILGYSYILLPSMPGHDADRVAATGTPISMVFVRQRDGVSHNPEEKMDMIDYKNAAHPFMKSVLAKLV